LSVGLNVDVNQPSTPWNESNGTIAINPTSPANLFAAAEGWGGPMLAAFSVDGGFTWINSNVSGLPIPNSTAANPRSAFDSFGNLFLTYRDGPGNTLCAFSFDGGMSFAGVFPVYLGNTSRPSITTGPGPSGSGYPGQVVVAVTLPGTGVIAAAAPVFGPTAVAPFGAPMLLSGSHGGDFSSVAVGPMGQVLVTYENPSMIVGPSDIRVNFDPALLLGVPFNPAVVAATTNVGFYPLPAQPMGIDAEPGLAWDQSGIGSPPPFGAVYLVYTNSPAPGDPATNVYLQTSFDGGTTWSLPVPVPDDLGPNSKFNPAIAVDQTTGDFAITWLDCRHDLGGGFPDDIDGFPNLNPEVYGMETIGGVIQPNVQISAGPSSGLDSFNPKGLGNYDGVAFNSGVFYPIWADNDPYFSLTPPNTSAPLLDMATAMVTPGPVAASRHGSRPQRSPITRSGSLAITGVFAPASPGLLLALPVTDATFSAATSRSLGNEAVRGNSQAVGAGDDPPVIRLGSDDRTVGARGQGDLRALETRLLEDPLAAS
jgi:hypothetical protein